MNCIEWITGHSNNIQHGTFNTTTMNAELRDAILFGSAAGVRQALKVRKQPLEGEALREALLEATRNGSAPAMKELLLACGGGGPSTSPSTVPSTSPSIPQDVLSEAMMQAAERSNPQAAFYLVTLGGCDVSACGPALQLAVLLRCLGMVQVLARPPMPSSEIVSALDAAVQNGWTAGVEYLSKL